jgi:hypothetical protein
MWRWLGEDAAMTRSDRSPEQYRIRSGGHLDPSLSVWFDDQAITQMDDRATTLTGPLIDQAALYGLLSRLCDVEATLLSVEHLANGEV